MNQDGMTNWLRKTQQITRDFMIQRDELGSMTPKLLLIFADGKVAILERIAAGLRIIAPGDPDLPIIHSTIHELKRSLKRDRYHCASGKSNPPTYSIPLEEVPQSLLSVIQESPFKSKLKVDLTYELRQILGAARRANVPENLSQEALSAHRAELDARGLSAITIERKVRDIQLLGIMFNLDNETKEIIASECRSAALVATHATWLCCTNPVRDSSCESSMVAGGHEQTHTPRLQDQELAGL